MYYCIIIIIIIMSVENYYILKQFELKQAKTNLLLWDFKISIINRANANGNWTT